MTADTRETPARRTARSRPSARRCEAAADCRAALRAAPAARLLNAYGLTETTITSALCDLRAQLEDGETASLAAGGGPAGPVPVGRATRHVRIKVLDENLDPAPAGEIYIGGCGVARGYLGQPALTAERFLPDPGGGAGLAACGGGAGLAAWDDRVVPLPGDLAAPRLGLSPGEFRELARSTDIIYHAGAIVNFIYPYEELRAANVTGTRELIRLAGLVRAIPVHYVSTTAVLAGLGVAGVREVTEDTPLAHADRLRIGYVETKFVAEELLRNAGRAGLPVAIYRPMDIIGSRRTGAWNTATEMCALIRFITDTGLAPDIDLPLDFVPADTCAAAIRHISAAEGATGLTYHLAGRGYALLGSLVERLRRHGFEVSEVPFGIWVSELLRYAAHDPSHPMAPFLPLFVDRDQDLTTAEMYLEHVFPHYTRSNTERALHGSGIAFPSADDGGLLDRNIGRLIATGYLTARPRAHAG